MGLKARTSCPGCAGVQSAVLYSRPYRDDSIRHFLNLKFTPEGVSLFEDALYVLRKCGDCGLIYQEYVPDAESAFALYNTYLPCGDRECLVRNGPPSAAFLYMVQELLLVQRLIGRAPGEVRMLDFGMGDGAWCAVAKAMGFKVEGVDLDETSVAKARADGVDAFPLSDLPGRTYDFINTEQVFEHLADPLSVLVELKAALGGQGVLKISVPCANRLERRLKTMDWSVPRSHPHFLVPVTPGIHLNAFSWRSLLAMGAKAGLVPIQPPLRQEYNILSLQGGRALLKSLLRPLYRRLVRHTYVFFRAA